MALLLAVAAMSALANRGPVRSWVLGSTQSHFDERAVGVAAAWSAAPPDDSTVLVDAGTGSCDTALEPLVWQSADVVGGGAAVRVPMWGGCDDMLNWHPLTITLDEPLGDRALLEAYSGGPVAPGWSYP